MKILIGIILAASLALTGCMSNPQLKQAVGNIETAKAEYKAGRMKGSEYYTLVYNEVSKTNASDKASAMRGASAMIDASFAYESGKITKRKFESIRRQVQTEFTDASQKQNAALAQAQSAYWRQVSSNMSSAPPYSGGLQRVAHALSSGNRPTMNCYSYRVGGTVQTKCN